MDEIAFFTGYFKLFKFKNEKLLGLIMTLKWAVKIGV